MNSLLRIKLAEMKAMATKKPKLSQASGRASPGLVSLEMQNIDLGTCLNAVLWGSDYKTIGVNLVQSQVCGKVTLNGF